MIWYLDSTPVQKNQECAVPLGIQGENQSLVYTADVSDWLALWPNGVVALVLQAPDRSDPYMANTSIDRETGIVTWTITEFDTSIVGYGVGELRIISGDVVKKSYRFATYIRPSVLSTAAEPPAPTPEWIAELLEVASDVQGVVNEAEAARDAAQTAQAAAELAQGKAETAQGKAEDAQTAAETAQGKAETAQTNAESAASNAQTYSQQASSFRGQAMIAKNEAVTAQGKAETAQGKAEAAQTAAETAQGKAEAAQTAAETAQGKAEDAQGAAETALASTLAAKDAAINAITAQQATSVAAVQAKGTEVIASIPQDYSALSGEVSDLQSALSGFENGICDIDIVQSVNLLPPTQESGYWDTSTGDPVASASYVRTPDFVPVETLPQGRPAYVYVKNNSWGGKKVTVIEYAADSGTPIKNYILGSNGSFTIYSTCTRIKVYTNSTSIPLENVCIRYDEGQYVEYGNGKDYTVKPEALPNKVQISSEEISDISVDISLFTEGYLGQSGNIISDNSYLVSPLIPVVPGTMVVIENYAGTAATGIHFYDNYGNHLRYSSASSGSSIAYTETTIENDTRAIRYSIKTTQTNNRCYYKALPTKTSVAADFVEKISSIKPNVFNPFSKLIPVCTFIDDDTISLSATQAFRDACVAQGIVGTFACVTKYLDTTGLPEQLLQYETEGFEITLHAQNHDPAFQKGASRTTAEEALVQTEVVNALKRLRDTGFNPENILYWVTPYGVHDEYIQKMAVRHGLRCIVSAANPEVDYGQSGKYFIHRPDILASTGDSLETLKGYIDEAVANNGWILFCSHFGYVDWVESGSKALWDDVVAYAKQSGICIATLAEGFRLRSPVYVADDMF